MIISVYFIYWPQLLRPLQTLPYESIYLVVRVVLCVMHAKFIRLGHILCFVPSVVSAVCVWSSCPPRLSMLELQCVNVSLVALRSFCTSMCFIPVMHPFICRPFLPASRRALALMDSKYRLVESCRLLGYCITVFWKTEILYK